MSAKVLDTIFSTYFDGQTVQVCSNGLYVEGSMESNCKLVYKSMSRIIFETDTEWNGTTKMAEFVSRQLRDKREELELTYSQVDTICNALFEDVKKAPVQIGSLYYSNVQSFNCMTNKDGDVTGIDLKFEDGTVQIRKYK
jgi:hypothetical protein